VIRAQRVSPPGTLFGQVAIEKGMLTSDEVARLLMVQQQRQRPVIEHLVELGRVSYEEAAAAARSRASRRLETGVAPAFETVGV
jgi:transcription initiation factor IIE alpha subunit